MYISECEVKHGNNFVTLALLHIVNCVVHFSPSGLLLGFKRLGFMCRVNGAAIGPLKDVA